jgi:general secretion pathway protein M
MKHWWLTLNQRERQLVLLAAVAVGLAVLYWGIWTPLASRVEAKKQTLELQQATLILSKQQGERILSAGGVQGATPDIDDKNLSEVIGQSASSQQIVMSRIQPRGESIDIWIDDVPFNQLMNWFIQLEQRYGLTVENLDLVAKDVPGTVSVRRLRLGRKE